MYYLLTFNQNKSTMNNFYLFVIILAILGLNSCSNRGLPIISKSSPEEKIVSQLKETKKCIKCNLENSNLNNEILDELFNHDIWMNSLTALKYGLIDEII